MNNSSNINVCSYIQQLRDGVHNFFVTFIEVLRDRPPGHDWELEPGVTCGDYLFGMLQVIYFSIISSSYLRLCRVHNIQIQKLKQDRNSVCSEFIRTC